MHKIRIFLFFVVTILFVGAGCDITASNKPKVAATIFPIYDLVRIIGGEDVEVVLIVPPGASPHTFEPTPSSIKELKNTSRIFQIGHGLDSWVSSIVTSIPGAQTITLDRNVQLYPTAEFHEHEHEGEEVGEEHEHGPVDPHYWMDPTNAYIMVDTIVEELVLISPEHTEEFALRAKNFKDELERKDFEWFTALSGLHNRKLVTFHDAFQYFARRFQLEIVATFEPFPGREPTPQYLIDLKEEVLLHEVKTLYLEPQFSAEAIETFASDNGLTIATLDPEGSGERASYLDMIGYNVQTIVENQK
ncbi:MAG: zinc ABC transporter substrate-binding protein [Candidatus Magasanikbacteria bacterium]|nr:zinc ABC transporter substrate-binding protein [Candidatus Magasanikbacteria bacterium]